MIRKILLCILVITNLIPIITIASSTSEVVVGSEYYDTLEEAIENARSNDTIKLINNVELKKTLDINKTVNINLNGNDISAPTKIFQVKGGVLNVNGKGTIREIEPNYGTIMVIGSDNIYDKEYSIVNIGEDVTLEGWSGIFVNHEVSKSYGVMVNFKGKINAINDINNGTGIGIYINGNIKDISNAPIINILENSVINSTGNGLYIAGYSTFNINNSTIKGTESGIGIKSGILNITNSKIESTGEDETPTEGYNNGIKPSGRAIQIESNDGYAGNIELNINSGEFISKNSNVIYEYIGKGKDTRVKKINISNGTFKSKNKNVFAFSKSFENNHKNFISGGEYTSNPEKYLKPGYSTSYTNNLYKVDKSTIKETFLEKNITTTTNIPYKIIKLILSITIFTIIYINRIKIINIIKSCKK